MTAEVGQASGSSIPARLRIIGWILLVTGLSFLALVLTVRSSLLSDVESLANQDVQQETAEFRTFAEQGVDPETGAPFTSAERLVRLHLTRQFPSDDELLVGRAGAPGAALVLQQQGRTSPLAEDPAAVQELLDAERTSGVAELASAPVRWGRVDVQVGPGDSGASFLVVESTADDVAAVGQVTRLLVVICLGGLLLTAGLAWLVAGQILAPVRLVRRAAARITRADSGERIEVHGRDDVAALAVTFNAMLDRLQRSFSAQQRFTEQAETHLRDPLDVLTQETSAGSPRAADALRRMRQILDDLALLARAERPGFVDVRATDASDLTRSVLRDAASAADREWVLESAAAGPVTLDPRRVREAMTRLATNATRFSPTGAVISIGSDRDDDAVRFWVRDTGPGLPPDEVDRVFERFARATEPVGATPTDPTVPGDAGDGAGLGLAVVRAVADAHGGSAFVRSAPGGGAVFGLELPAAPAGDQT